MRHNCSLCYTRPLSALNTLSATLANTFGRTSGHGQLCAKHASPFITPDPLLDTYRIYSLCCTHLGPRAIVHQARVARRATVLKRHRLRHRRRIGVGAIVDVVNDRKDLAIIRQGLYVGTIMYTLLLIRK